MIRLTLKTMWQPTGFAKHWGRFMRHCFVILAILLMTTALLYAQTVGPIIKETGIGKETEAGDKKLKNLHSFLSHKKRIIVGTANFPLNERVSAALISDPKRPAEFIKTFYCCK